MATLIHSPSRNLFDDEQAGTVWKKPEERTPTRTALRVPTLVW